MARLRLDDSTGVINEYLVVAKNNSIELFTVGKQDNLESVLEIPLYADLIHINKIPSSVGTEPDMLFILTEELKFIFCYVSRNKLDNKYSGELEQKPLHDDFVPKIISYPPPAKSSLDRRRRMMVNQSLLPMEEEGEDDKIPATPVNNNKNNGYFIIQGNQLDIRVIGWKETGGNINVAKPFSVRLDDNDIFEYIPLLKEKAPASEIHLGVLLRDELSFLYKEIVFDERSQRARNNTNNGWIIRFIHPIEKLISLSNGNLLAFYENNIR
jgi:hypothetical protein